MFLHRRIIASLTHLLPLKSPQSVGKSKAADNNHYHMELVIVMWLVCLLSDLNNNYVVYILRVGHFCITTALHQNIRTVQNIIILKINFIW